MTYPQMVTPVSDNMKLGPGVSSTYRPVGETCPDCAIAAICYARRGNVASAAKRSGRRKDRLGKLNGAPFVRHLVSGDVMRRGRDGRRIVDREYVRDVIAHHEDNPEVVGWMYSHAWKQLGRAGFGPTTLPNNLIVLASVDSPGAAEDAQADGWTTARTTDDLTTLVAGEIACPYDRDKRELRGKPKPINCIKCRACFDGRGRNIVFLRS